MPVDQPDIIRCGCGQRMRIPAESESNFFKCVRCGALVERDPEGTFLRKTGRQLREGTSTLTGSDALLEIFADAGLITDSQADAAKEEYITGKEKIFETLLRLKMVTAEQFYACMTKESGTASINLANFSIDRAFTELIPFELASQHWILPIDKLGRSLTVAMVCPMDAEAIAAVEHHSGLRLRPMLCAMEDFRNSLHKHYSSSSGGDQAKAKGKAKEPAEKKQAPDATSKPADEPKRKPAPKTEPVPEPLDSAAPAVVQKRDVARLLPLLETLPIRSHVMNQVDATVGSGPESLRQIVAISEKSPPFTAKLLSAANSHGFGIPGRVESIPMAVALLGEEAVGIIAATMPKYPGDSERTWSALNQYSRNAALLASALASACGRVVPGLAHCAALLHGIGSYALAEVFKEDYQEIDPKLTGPRRQQKEEQIFGIGHARAGAVLGRSWHLPEPICFAIGFYTAPADAEAHRDIAEIVYIATHIAKADGSIDKDGLNDCGNALKYLQIKPDVASEILQAYVARSAPK